MYDSEMPDHEELVLRAKAQYEIFNENGCAFFQKPSIALPVAETVIQDDIIHILSVAECLESYEGRQLDSHTALPPLVIHEVAVDPPLFDDRCDNLLSEIKDGEGFLCSAVMVESERPTPSIALRDRATLAIEGPLIGGSLNMAGIARTSQSSALFCQDYRIHSATLTVWPEKGADANGQGNHDSNAVRAVSMEPLEDDEILQGEISPIRIEKSDVITTSDSSVILASFAHQWGNCFDVVNSDCMGKNPILNEAVLSLPPSVDDHDLPFAQNDLVHSPPDPCYFALFHYEPTQDHSDSPSPADGPYDFHMSELAVLATPNAYQREDDYLSPKPHNESYIWIDTCTIPLHVSPTMAPGLPDTDNYDIEFKEMRKQWRKQKKEHEAALVVGQAGLGRRASLGNLPGGDDIYLRYGTYFTSVAILMGNRYPGDDQHHPHMSSDESYDSVSSPWGFLSLPQSGYISSSLPTQTTSYQHHHHHQSQHHGHSLHPLEDHESTTATASSYSDTRSLLPQYPFLFTPLLGYGNDSPTTAGSGATRDSSSTYLPSLNSPSSHELWKHGPYRVTVGSGSMGTMAYETESY
ncbi:hypothetical protein K435DRAFT_143726 [Dendrothele bispora CBS 962.96]|uniref:Uncharacterized protein n=1 Tax=Dendrothele bispora (strain CBS 962.96) TaxID=1314807 RepID=A0A4S8M020_DENBC|nr:hypothetical protein K435DRAFT_143726 [Dendrothele bispora CBS 962.96]